MLEFALLGLLHEAPVHGYELRKQLALRLGGLRASPTDRSTRPCGGSRARASSSRSPGRTRRAEAAPRQGVYRITAEGKERFDELLAEAGPQA